MKKLFSQLNSEGFNYYLNQIKQIKAHPFSTDKDRNDALRARSASS